jgi:uncharacterized surface protein with fasciclin (FAS1) repeats
MRHIRRFLVLLALTAVTTTAAVPLAGACTEPQRNIVQTAAAAGHFKTLVELAKRAGLAGVLSAQGPFTVFAPTDAAFAQLPKATLTALARDKSKLRAVLLLHVLKGRYTAARLATLHSVKTLNGQSLTVRVSHGVVTVGGARVIKTNIGASNGVIHVINRVLTPR